MRNLIIILFVFFIKTSHCNTESTELIDYMDIDHEDISKDGVDVEHEDIFKDSMDIESNNGTIHNDSLNPYELLINNSVHGSLELQIAKNLRPAEKNFYVMAQQITHESFIEYIIKTHKLPNNEKPIFIVEDGQQNRNFFEKIAKKNYEFNTFFLKNADTVSGLKHNKIILTEKQAFVGSPNFTHFGLKFSQESMILLNRDIMKSYAGVDYTEPLELQVFYNIIAYHNAYAEARGGRLAYTNFNFQQYTNFINTTAERLNLYKQNLLVRNNHIRICILPTCNMSDYLSREVLSAKNEILIQTFLIDNNDFVRKLAILKKFNNKINIVINTDKKIYDKFQSMKDAIRYLRKNNIKVNLIDLPSKSGKQPNIHDKVMIIDKKIAIIGTGNLSKNVIDSENSETFISIQDAPIVNDLTQYFYETQRNKVN